MDTTIPAGIREKTLVQSEGIGFNEQADRWPHVFREKITDGQVRTNSFYFFIPSITM